MLEKQAVFSYPHYSSAGNSRKSCPYRLRRPPCFYPGIVRLPGSRSSPDAPLEIAHSLVYTAKLESSYSIQNTNLKNKQTSHSPKLAVFRLKIRTCEGENTNSKGKKNRERSCIA